MLTIVRIFISNVESNDRFIYQDEDIQSLFRYSYLITMVLSIIYVWWFICNNAINYSVCCAILLSLFFLVSWYVWYNTEPYAKHTNKRIPVCGHKQFSFGTLSLMHTSYIISSAMQNLVILSFYSKSYLQTNIVISVDFKKFSTWFRIM